MTHQEMLPSKMKFLIVDLLSLKLTNGVFAGLFDGEQDYPL
jgi:hypothetical protein